MARATVEQRTRPWAPNDRRVSQRDGSGRQHFDHRVIFDRGWLPPPDALDGVELPGVAELRERHHELLDDLRAARADLNELRAQYSREDEEQADHWASGESGKLPKVTDQAVRIANQRRASEEVAAAQQEVVAFAEEVIEGFDDLGAQWTAHLEARANRAAERRSELEAELARLRRDDVYAERLDSWMHRVTDYRPGFLLPWTLLQDTDIPEGAVPGASGGDGTTFLRGRPDEDSEPPDEPVGKGDGLQVFNHKTGYSNVTMGDVA